MARFLGGQVKRIASNTSRKHVVRGRPVGLGGGIKGASSAHSASVKSLAYLSPSRACWLRVSSVQAIVVSVQCRSRTESQPPELTQLVSNRALRARDCLCRLFDGTGRVQWDLPNRRSTDSQAGRRRSHCDRCPHGKRSPSA